MVARPCWCLVLSQALLHSESDIIMELACRAEPARDSRRARPRRENTHRERFVRRRVRR